MVEASYSPGDFMPGRTFSGAVLIAAAISLVPCSLLAQQQGPSSEGEDKYLYLEEAHGAKAMDWVKAENARTAAVLEADPRFKPYEAEALKIAEDPNRLAEPTQHGNEIYNFWQDAEHVHGILRKTTLADYLQTKPVWQTVIDYDALAKTEKTSWVSRGLNCLYPGETICLAGLSVGGEDADSDREFDLRTGQFVANGFTLPRSKQQVSWKDADTLYVARDWGPGTMTKSGYPFVVKEWKRGTPLDSAVEVYRGTESDISADAQTLHDAQGDKLTVFERGVDFFSHEYKVLTASGPQLLAVPGKSDLDGVFAGRLLVTINEDWTPAGQGTTYKQGSLVALKLSEVKVDPGKLKPEVVFAPTSTEFLDGVSTTKDRLLLTTLKHVQGTAYVYAPGASGWTRTALPVPENVTVRIVDTSATSDTFFLAITGFLTPSSIYEGDATAGTMKEAHSQPAQFDGSKDEVEQLEATSKDGTKVPYFVVHAKGMKYDGSNPTVLTAYGGFQVSMTPSYQGYTGKLWLEKGGVFVLANIRGGGEFGPAWHEAGLKTHRQRIYDDFAAVGEDLIARKITSTPHLGIVGGSNGGLLMGVEMTQHPNLWGAILIQVPLLDMLRFEQIEAGASWVGEYGSVSVPEERAFLAGISPYNQLKPGVKYPTPLIFTTTKDDRVGPEHARKFAAKMEEFHDPFFYDEITEGGHGAGANLKEDARTYAEAYVYFSKELMGK